jgi:Fe-S-cluster containining protein
MTDGGDAPAGNFSTWLGGMEAAIRGNQSSDVPCDGCTACCTAGQFIHISPDEADTLAHIPRALLFPAPRAPTGHVLMGYDEHGRCPMLIDDRCSIYEHRPRTCRTYDCRIFPATGIEPDDKPDIAARARRWKFTFSTDDERAQHEALVAAAADLVQRAEVFPGGNAAATPTALAVAAVRVALTSRARSASDDESKTP